MNRNCLSYWFPLIQAAGLPVPRTEIVRTEVELIRLFDREEPNGMGQFLADLEAAARRIGPEPYFMRTGQGSGKHHWKNTCYLANLDKLRDHVINLTEWSELVRREEGVGVHSHYQSVQWRIALWQPTSSKS